MYVSALTDISTSLTTAVFGVTPALVVLLAVPLLRRRLTPASVVAAQAKAEAAAAVVRVAKRFMSTSSLAPSSGNRRGRLRTGHPHVKRAEVKIGF